MEKGAQGTLYLIPCPIGETSCGQSLPPANTGIIRTLNYFVVENVRTARRFLAKSGIGKPIDQLHFEELNEHTRAEELARLLKPLEEGNDAGLISEAGLPAVADPGADLVALCHKKGIVVKPLVGPSSIMLALMASGLNGQSFAFNGYLPIKPPERARALRHFDKISKAAGQTQIFIEAPYRNQKLFEDIITVCSPHTLLCVAVDLTDPEEYIRTQTVGQWKAGPLPQINKRPAIFLLL